MTSTEIFRALNEFLALYPNHYKNQTRESMERIAKSWNKKFESVDDYDVFVDALYEYERSSDYSNPPTTKQMLDLYNARKSRKRKENRRIETPEEVMYEIYHNELQKENRNEELMNMCKPAARLFTNPEAYKRHFGSYREEFEKL